MLSMMMQQHAQSSTSSTSGLSSNVNNGVSFVHPMSHSGHFGAQFSAAAEPIRGQNLMKNNGSAFDNLNSSNSAVANLFFAGAASKSSPSDTASDGSGVDNSGATSRRECASNGVTSSTNQSEAANAGKRIIFVNVFSNIIYLF